MLLQLLRYDPRSVPSPGMPGYGARSGAPAVMLAYLKHIWSVGEREQALRRRVAVSVSYRMSTEWRKSFYLS